jgi:hypothetical protein
VYQRVYRDPDGRDAGRALGAGGATPETSSL